MRVVIASAGSPDYSDLAAVTNPSRVRYAEKHGYAYVYKEIPKELGDACKREMYFELLGYGFDVFVWMDLDSIVTNSEVRIEDIVTENLGDGHFLWSYDYAGPNSGVYITRYTPQGAHWMDRAYATMLENGLADETAMEILQTTAPFRDWVRVIPGRVMNAYPSELYGWDKWGIDYARTVNHWEPGCFICHLPGLPNEKRIPLLKQYLLEAK